MISASYVYSLNVVWTPALDLALRCASGPEVVLRLASR